MVDPVTISLAQTTFEFSKKQKQKKKKHEEPSRSHRRNIRSLYDRPKVSEVTKDTVVSSTGNRKNVSNLKTYFKITL